ncbi:hypothetical protein KKH23_00815, partial [Patescibacteria group bacterium]|nr:hypothetical protein [Patescibacteria group bacterium]
ISEEYLNLIEEKRSQYKTLRSFYANERAGKRISKKKEDDLREVGLTTENIPEENAIVSSILLDSLSLTYQLIHQTDPQQGIDNTKPRELEYVTLCAKANIVFTNFFIDLHKRFGASNKQVENIFGIIFDQSPLGTDLKERGLKGFREGMLAAIKGYLYLAKLKPGWKIETPEVVLDRDHGIDLVATSSNSKEIHYYQIKGARGQEVQVEDVTSSQKMEKVRNRLVLSSKRSSRNDLRSLGNIFDYARNLRTQGKEVNAFWMQVPI